MRRFNARLGVALATVAVAAGVSVPAASAIKITSVSGAFVDTAGNPVRQAGSHPDVKFSFRIDTDHSKQPVDWLGDDIYPIIEAFHRVKTELRPVWSAIRRRSRPVRWRGSPR